VTDTDHLWGIGGDRRWAWRSFTRGYNPIFMDTYDDEANVWLPPGTPPPDAPKWESLRRNLGDIRALAARVPMESMQPMPSAASTGYVLAAPDSGNFIVYVPEPGRVTVDLSTAPRVLRASWFDPARRTLRDAGSLAGGAQAVLESPFESDAVLWIRP